ncbi:hypothetical protein I6N90_07670 [Paenibacillus sp. GSMTC-2017]|uniref:hypothetical protein n=1 Tax=Paenibacillus sp. GSMTC-2017 TaxID=2794350 RepID=UPI0018D73388|nr:hypothetical protein [Paenibacillus sp. GSMTC-2017]MBH5317678.1 hypothetical protein [Paenibacillus sp. GSMTC-2017]
MKISNRVKVVLIGGIFLLVIIAVFIFNTPKTFYGNDEKSIIKAIHSIPGYEKDSISILAINDVDDSRVVGLLVDESPGYAQFTRNKKGNYKWHFIEVRRGESFSTFLPDMTDKVKRSMMIVTNDKNEIAKMEVRVNGELIQQTFNPKIAKVTWIELPESIGGHRFDDYKYYGKDGELLEG